MEASLPQLRVLVIDDDRDSATAFAELLKLDGYVVQIVADALKALETARNFRPQVIFLDIAMPARNGNEIARQLRREPSLYDAVIVAISGYCSDADRQVALAAGADYFLAKPVKMATLREVLLAALSLHLSAQ
jgi:CheY-like chemotaxis protein